MLNYLYHITWLLLCFLVDFYDVVRWLILQLHSSFYKSYDLISCNTTISQALQDQAYLERCKLELNKIPKHLNIVVGPHEGIGGEVLSRIVFYALSLDIDCISFYDTRTYIDAGKQRFAIETVEQLPLPQNVCSKKLQHNRFIWSISSPALTNSKQNVTVSTKNGVCNGVANGASNGASANSAAVKSTTVMEKKIEVVLLNEKDGRALIAKVCQELRQQRQTTEMQEILKNRALLIERIDMTLKEKLSKLPDPELGIIFNKHTCTFGLMPWQTRFTEFHTIETGQYFSVETFAKVLYRYSRCEQRWGK